MGLSAKLKVFASGDALGRHAAEEILTRWEAAPGPALTLGCPGGRSPRSTYAALAEALRGRKLDGRRIHLMMMDDYIERRGSAWRPCPADAHYSCARFGEVEIRQVLNEGLTDPIPPENLHLPDPEDPLRYERLIAALGGIDVFILASGASDGHVAFNPPGTEAHERTRRVELAATTRADNVGTFPQFSSADEVPRFGVSVGPATIATHARTALMILIGAEKGVALKRILSAGGYAPDWPASVINVCRNGSILADEDAARAAGR